MCTSNSTCASWMLKALGNICSEVFLIKLKKIGLQNNIYAVCVFTAMLSDKELISHRSC